MRLAFTGKGRYTDFSKGYSLYARRSRKGEFVDVRTYNKVVREFCNILAQRLLENGIVDLPCDMGSIAAVTLTRKPQYRGKKFIGLGKMDWDKGHYDGSYKAFGFAYLPRRKSGNANLRSYGFVANRKLFRKMKEKYNSGECAWTPIEYKDEMI